MLTLTNIRKDYGTDSDTVHALRGVSIRFRPHEFVAILGPSGCGKTTLLNIIGGLDHYTDGDLVIGGVSTKEYKDHDWDVYRNHRVGFIFQTYNLIPHQTVLANVELALTLSGIPKSERRLRATEALGQVGLGDQLKKKPGQMSGGQMQRVAIARALVNHPDIVLADEPTGALDTQTSVQIMEILKEISTDKLIVMVTHNPELAERYATRIIRVLDGQVISDSNPYDGVSEELPPETEERESAEIRDTTELVAFSDSSDTPETGAIASDTGTDGATPKKKKPKKAKKQKTSMSFWTALSLSLNNLLTKKTRTFLTAFAGSIGIIGIALILSLSNGIGIFIDRVQEDALSSYPVQISANTMDLAAMLSAFQGAGDEDFTPEDGKVYSGDQLSGLTKAIFDGYKENDLVALKEYIESDESTLKQHATVQYHYGVTPQVYHVTENEDGTSEYLAVSPSEVYNTLMTYMGMEEGSMTMTVWDEIIDNPDLLEKQYSVLEGHWPENYDEVVIVTDKNHKVSDIMLYAIGLKDQDELMGLLSGKENEGSKKEWTFEELLGTTYRMVLAADYYEPNAEGGYSDIRKKTGGLADLLSDESKVVTLKVVGIVAANPDATATSISGVVGYSSALTKYIVNETTKQNPDGTYVYPIVGKQLENEDFDVIQNKPFYVEDTSDTAAKAEKLDAWLASATDEEIAVQYGENLDSILFVKLYNELYGQIVSGGKTREQLISGIEEMMENDSLLFSRVKRQLAKMKTPGADELAAQLSDSSAFKSFLTLLKAQDGSGNYNIPDAYAMPLLQGLYPLFDLISEGTYDILLEEARANLESKDPTERANDYRAYVRQLEGETEETAAAAVPVKAMLWDTYYQSTTSKSTYRANCRLLGITNEDTPSAIYLYPVSFADKDAIVDEIDRYNQNNPNKQITYTDYIGIMLNSVSVILQVITYVLVAFVSISLVVSSIMIGIITYISVLERIKEIGILRAIGASKRDISHVFQAETLIVGFTAGVIGILFTLILCIPVNVLIRALSGFREIGASLPPLGAIILILISMGLTLIAGLIPARIAAKKEPVEALRSE